MRFLFVLALLYAPWCASADQALLDFSDIQEKKSQMVSSRIILAVNEAASDAYEFLYEGREFIVYPHVYSPQIFPSTFYCAKAINIEPGQSFLEIGSGTGLL